MCRGFAIVRIMHSIYHFLLKPYTVVQAESIIYFDSFDFGLTFSFFFHATLLIILTIIIPFWVRPTSSRKFAIRVISWSIAVIYWLWFVITSLYVGRSDATIPTAVVGCLLLSSGAVALLWFRSPRIN